MIQPCVILEGTLIVTMWKVKNRFIAKCMFELCSLLEEQKRHFKILALAIAKKRIRNLFASPFVPTIAITNPSRI